MSDIKLVRMHSLPLAKAKALAQKTADALSKEYDLSSGWSGDTLRFHRSGVDGQMHVTDSEIRLDVSLGLLLKAFKGTIAAHIERNLDELLAGSKTPTSKTAASKTSISKTSISKTPTSKTPTSKTPAKKTSSRD